MTVSNVAKQAGVKRSPPLPVLRSGAANHGANNRDVVKIAHRTLANSGALRYLWTDECEQNQQRSPDVERSAAPRRYGRHGDDL